MKHTFPRWCILICPGVVIPEFFQTGKKNLTFNEANCSLCCRKWMQDKTGVGSIETRGNQLFLCCCFQTLCWNVTSHTLTSGRLLWKDLGFIPSPAISRPNGSQYPSPSAQCHRDGPVLFFVFSVFSLLNCGPVLHFSLAILSLFCSAHWIISSAVGLSWFRPWHSPWLWSDKHASGWLSRLPGSHWTSSLPASLCVLSLLPLCSPTWRISPSSVSLTEDLSLNFAFLSALQGTDQMTVLSLVCG